jgi:hypothetical protein
MTAPARLTKSPAAPGEKVVPRDARPARLAVLTRPLPAPPAPPVPAPPLAPPVRRHRVASVVAAAAVTLALVGGLSWIGQGASPGIPAQTAVVRVGAGETVWDVAWRVAPRSDQRAVVERIRQLNGIVGSAIEPGQQLQVPDGR